MCVLRVVAFSYNCNFPPPPFFSLFFMYVFYVDLLCDQLLFFIHFLLTFFLNIIFINATTWGKKVDRGV